MTHIVNVGHVIDAHPIGSFQARAFLLCAAVLFVDGFDVQGITYVAPAISQEWNLPRGALGPTFSAGLFGVMLGAMLFAPLADRIGRRRVIISSCIAFGVGTLLTIWVPSLTALLMLRFLTGLGLGAALPNAIGLASEYAPRRRRALIVMFVGSGISLGSIASGMAAAQLISTLGWRAVFVLGGVLPLALAAILARWLPESIRFAALTPERQPDARRLLREIRPEMAVADDARLESGGEGGKATVADLFRDGRVQVTPVLWVAFFMSLLNVYLVINWLPTSLHAAGFSQEQAAVMASLYHAGGVAGTYALGLLMDRVGIHRMLMLGFLVSITGFYVFATTSGLAAAATTAVLIATGFGVVGGQVGITTLASIVYPVSMRSTGLGWALGVGRVGSIIGPTVGGLMLATAADPRSVYLACILPAAAGFIAIAWLKRVSAPAAHARPVGAPARQEAIR